MAKLDQFKALLFDVDRTLVTSEREFPPGLKLILTRFHQAGFILGVCTGRSYPRLVPELMPFFKQLNLTAFHVVCGGAELVNSSGELFFQQGIEPNLVNQLISGITHYERFMIATHNQVYMEGPDREIYKIMNNKRPSPLQAYQNEPASLISIHGVEPDHPQLIALNQQVQIKAMHTSEGISYVDLTALGVTKATALQHWSRLSNIPLQQVIGFGDNHNDFEFLQTVGFKVAMGNAVAEIKQIADRVIGDVEQNGLSEYLEKVLKTQEL